MKANEPELLTMEEQDKAALEQDITAWETEETLVMIKIDERVRQEAALLKEINELLEEEYPTEAARAARMDKILAGLGTADGAEGDRLSDVVRMFVKLFVPTDGADGRPQEAEDEHR